MRRIALIAALLFVAAASPAAAQALIPDAPQRDTVMLSPGDYVWYETAAFTPASAMPGNGISIVISIPSQLAYVYRNGMLIAVSTISTGKPGKETPLGEFAVLEKQVFHRSNLYSAAPMPFMQRLTWDGIALHAGHLPGYPASHGCIRLPRDFAKKLYAVTALGATVSIVDDVLDDPSVNPWGPPPPSLGVDLASLGGERFNHVTVDREPVPPSLIEAVRASPGSWVLGPRQEIVQPLPAGER